MELIESILNPDPAARASLWYIREHAWVKQACNLEDYKIQVKVYVLVSKRVSTLLRLNFVKDIFKIYVQLT